MEINIFILYPFSAPLNNYIFSNNLTLEDISLCVCMVRHDITLNILKCVTGKGFAIVFENKSGQFCTIITKHL